MFARLLLHTYPDAARMRLLVTTVFLSKKKTEWL